MASLYDIIKKPVVSEKSTALAEIGNRYTFEVTKSARKPQIAEAVEKLFNVKVEKVRTINTHGRTKYVGRQAIKKPNKKKAIVTIAEGQKIDFFQTK